MLEKKSASLWNSIEVYKWPCFQNDYGYACESSESMVIQVAKKIKQKTHVYMMEDC